MTEEHDPDTTPPAEDRSAPESQSPAPEASAPPWGALQRLAGIRARMDSQQHEAFDRLVSRVGPEAAAELVALIPQSGNEAAPAEATPSTPGHTATAAMAGPRHPASREEYLQLVREARRGDSLARREVDFLRRDSSFDMNSLPSVREQSRLRTRDRINSGAVPRPRKGKKQ